MRWSSAPWRSAGPRPGATSSTRIGPRVVRRPRNAWASPLAAPRAVWAASGGCAAWRRRAWRATAPTGRVCARWARSLAPSWLMRSAARTHGRSTTGCGSGWPGAGVQRHCPTSPGGGMRPHAPRPHAAPSPCRGLPGVRVCAAARWCGTPTRRSTPASGASVTPWTAWAVPVPWRRRGTGIPCPCRHAPTRGRRPGPSCGWARTPMAGAPCCPLPPRRAPLSGAHPRRPPHAARPASPRVGWDGDPRRPGRSAGPTPPPRPSRGSPVCPPHRGCAPTSPAPRTATLAPPGWDRRGGTAAPAAAPACGGVRVGPTARGPGRSAMPMPSREASRAVTRCARPMAPPLLPR